MEQKEERGKADKDVDPADKIDPHLILLPFQFFYCPPIGQRELKEASHLVHMRYEEASHWSM